MREYSRGGSLPQPISVLIPAAVDREPDFGEQMVEHEATVSPEVSEVLVVLVGFVSHSLRLIDGHGLRGLV